MNYALRHACLVALMASAAFAQAVEPAAAPATQPVLVIHGGAGVVRAGMSAQDERDARAALEQALRAGHRQLAAGKPAIDAVTAAITVLEDAPMFNAGRGAVF